MLAVALTALLAGLVALMAGCGSDAQSVREANLTPSAAVEETATPSAKIRATQLRDGDCVDSTIPESISIETVVIVPCSGDWAYRVTNTFEVAAADAYPGANAIVEQADEKCDRISTLYLYPQPEGWVQGDRTVRCLQEASDPSTPGPVAALDSTQAPTPTPAPTRTPSPTPLPTATPQPTATPEQAADATPTAAEVYARVAPSMAFIETPAGTGSGVLIKGGYIVTNHHVVWPYGSVWATFPDGTSLGVPVIGWDSLADLAVLGPVDVPVETVRLTDGEALAPGSELYLVGYPAETEAFPEPTITRGILSRLREWELAGMTYLQTDAAIARGQSGGVLLDTQGRVIGISTYLFSEAGFGLATSITDDIVIIDELINSGWDTDDPVRAGIPTGDGNVSYTIELESDLATVTFVLDGEAGMTLELLLEGPGNGAFYLSEPGGLVGVMDGGETGKEYAVMELGVDGPYFVRVEMHNVEPQQFELSGNAPMRPFPDPSDGEYVQVWETVVGNVDEYADFDVFWLSLEEGDTVAVYAESTAIDTQISMGDAARPETVVYDNDSGGTFGTDSLVFYRAPQPGDYAILVSDVTGDKVGGYLLGVEDIDALEFWDSDGDGQVSCPEARSHDIAPVHFTHPAYGYMDDDDGNGVVCE